MKYKPKLYAKALAQSLLEKTADENKIRENFISLLEKNGDMGKASHILHLAENIFIEKTGRRRLTIESARRIKPKQKELVNSILQKGDIVAERINKDLLAGIKIIINESRQFDGSMRKKLQNIL